MSELTIKSLEEALQFFREAIGHRWTDRERWKDKDERKLMVRDDILKGRGKLVLNPEAFDASEWVGRIVRKDGAEFRIVSSPEMVGMRIRDEDGNETDKPVAGFWVKGLKFDPFIPLIKFGVDV